MTAPTSLPNSPSESRSQSTHQRQNGRFKTAVADHPQWRENLAKRHILEAVIKAGAWVEWDQEAQQDVLVWREKRRDGSPGATRRRLLQPISDNGKTPAKVRWQFRGQKTDEPFFYVGTLDNLKLHITAAGGRLYIVEGEFDVWSLRRLGMRNVIGIYGISNIPKDIASLFNNLGVSRFIFYADNDEAGDRGASNMRTLLHESAWQGESEYRQFAGPGIPEKGDANDLLCHHYPDLSAARAALGALPRFEPNLKRKKAVKPASAIDCHDERWGAVNEANRIALGVTYFKANGFSKNIRCPNPDHEDKTPSAALHKDGFCTCQVCGTFNSKQLADWVDIDWRALLRPQPQIVSSKDTDLAAAPQTVAETAPLSFEQAPDSWLRLLNKFYKPTVALLFLYILRARKAGLLIPDFTRGECIKAVRELGCNVSDGAIYKVFQQVGKHDDQPLFVKADPSGGSSVKNRKFQLRQLDDIRRRLLHGIRYRVYESTFHKQRDTLINFKVFDQARLGSEFTKSLESALEPLYREQKPRFEALKHICEQKIATYQAELDDLHATPLPDWPIDQPCELPALLARGIYEADPEDHSKREWARLLGISQGKRGRCANTGRYSTPGIYQEGRSGFPA